MNFSSSKTQNQGNSLVFVGACNWEETAHKNFNHNTNCTVAAFAVEFPCLTASIANNAASTISPPVESVKVTR